jgi:hypothetical protein
MSTLVKFLLAAVLNIMHAGEVPNIVDQFPTVEQSTCQAGLQQLNPNFVVTRDELLYQLNERAL